MNRKAEMGVGTLIIFISLLLVAAVAAGVLIQTAGSLQQRALSTGTQATSQISTNALVLEVSATNGSDTAGINAFSEVMKLAPGSDPIKLADVTLTYSTSTDSITYNYRNFTNASAYCGTNTTAVDCVQVSGKTGNFTVEYMQEGPSHQNGVLVRGDVIKLYFNVTNKIGEGQHVRISFIPKIGTPTTTEFDTPDVMSTERVYLYP